MVTAAWLLMRGDHPLPTYPGREAYYGFCLRFSHAPVDSEGDRADLAGFLPTTGACSGRTTPDRRAQAR